MAYQIGPRSSITLGHFWLDLLPKFFCLVSLPPEFDLIFGHRLDFVHAQQTVTTVLIIHTVLVVMIVIHCIRIL